MKTNRFIRLLQHFACVSLTALATTAFAQTSRSLVLSMPLDLKVQGQIKDSSTFHNNGKVTGIIVTNSPSLVSMQETRQLSFSAWIKPDSIPNEFPVILSKGGNKSPYAYGGYEFILNANGDHDLGFVSGPVSIWTSGNLINNRLGEWIHIAFTLDDQNKVAMFYVNGVPTPVAAWNGSENNVSFNVSNNLYIGIPDPASEPNRRNFDGAIQDLKLWNRVLSPEELRRIYVEGKGSPARFMLRKNSFNRI